MRREPAAALLVIVALIVTGCLTAKPAAAPTKPDRIVAQAVDPYGTIWWALASGSSCSLSMRTADGKSQKRFEVPFCPEGMEANGDGSLLLRSSRLTELRDSDGSLLLAGRQLLAARDRTHFLQRDGGWLLHWGDKSVALAPSSPLRDVVISENSATIWALQNRGASESLVRLDGAGEHVVMSAHRIDSFAMSPDETEIVVSAMRDGSFDPAIIAADGSKTKWVSPDPAPETDVTWAPRGHKISYVVHTAAGSLVRTVHVPTGFAVAVSFPSSSLISLKWEPKAERLAILYSSLTSPSRIDLVAYQSGDHQIVAQSGPDFPGEAEPFSWKGATTIVLPPAGLRYGAREPVVVWKGSNDVFEWNEATAQLRRDGTGVIVTSASAVLDAGFWSEVARLSWVDPARTFVVERPGSHSRYPDNVQTILLTAPQPGRSAEDELESSAVSRLEMLLKGKNRIDGRS
ncbi:MAG TPA: hypothetical protein VHL58_14465 [Thermoanaerobaculia bacterium]|nr:hypothetical protein [Thermoanaerobaculia bacterium]